jgi:hypothetical protein
MPAEDGPRLDDDQARPPTSPKAGETDPEEPISPTASRALQRPLGDSHLLAQRQVLGSERRAVLEQQPEEDRDDL